MSSRLSEIAVNVWPIGSPAWICCVTDQPVALSSLAILGAGASGCHWTMNKASEVGLGAPA